MIPTTRLSVDTFRTMTLHMLKHFGLPLEGLELKIESRGAPPLLSAAEVLLRVPVISNTLAAAHWVDEGMIKRIRGITFSMKVSPQMEKNRMIYAARGVFNNFIPDVHIFTDHRSGPAGGRETARILADECMKRVIIVDTSNEIGGDGDVPHSGIGHARRMQVPNVSMQHNVMIEAVENHMPEVIIIDEIGTELEAMAASTIAQRGVQLVGTAHGVTIDSIIKNPCLQILVGGIESVTLGDEEARKRKVQKTILERKGPPTFTCAVEMISKTECRVHHKLEATVDAILAGKSPMFEVRKVDGKMNNLGSPLSLSEKHYEEEASTSYKENVRGKNMPAGDDSDMSFEFSRKGTNKTKLSRRSPIRVYTYKILEADLLQVANVMGFEDELDVIDDIGTADVILASSAELKQNPWIRSVAKYHQLPVFVIKANTMAQMVKAVKMILEMETFGSVKNGTADVRGDIEIEDDAPNRKPSLEEIDALEEARLAIEYIVIPGGEPVELLPRCSEFIARQLELVESYQLAAETSGTELNSWLQILPVKIKKKSSSQKNAVHLSSKKMDINSLVSSESGGAGVSRLPLLPE